MSRKRIALIPIFTILLSCITLAHATDQMWEHMNLPTTASFIFGGEKICQTFTVGNNSHNVSHINLKLYKYGNNPVMNVSIRETDIDGEPTGSDLTIATFTQNQEAKWYDVAVPEIELDANTVYAIILYRIPPYLSCTHGWFLKIDNPYPDGKLGEYKDGVWTMYPEYDGNFEIWGEEIEAEHRYLTVIEPIGNGGTNVTVGVHEYSIGENVYVAATPDDYWVFSQWNTEIGEVNDTKYDNPIHCIMDENMTIQAVFTNSSYRYLTVLNPIGQGHTNLTVGVHEYPVGEVVEVLAIPNHSWNFSVWYIWSQGVNFTQFSNPAYWPMTYNATIQAKFMHIESPPPVPGEPPVHWFLDWYSIFWANSNLLLALLITIVPMCALGGWTHSIFWAVVGADMGVVAGWYYGFTPIGYILIVILLCSIYYYFKIRGSI